MAVTRKGRTRADEAYAQIYSAILDGVHPPGSRLVGSSLQEQYGLSVGVMREVLTRLAGVGLVRAESQRGFRVIDVSADDLRQLTESQVIVERALLEQAILHGDLDFEARLTAAHHKLERTPHDMPDGRTNEDWRLAHAEFHRQLLSGSPNQHLRRIATSLRDQATVFQSWSRAIGGDIHRDAAGEHREILEAVLARDTDRALATLTAHIERTRDILVANTASLTAGTTATGPNLG